MKKLNNKSGFTLVECVVAMAVLAIMSLLLTMILSITVTTRNNNRAIEREVDKQVSDIVENNSDVTAEAYTSQIIFEKTDAVGNAIYSETIPGADETDPSGNPYDLDADRVYNTSAEAEIDALKYDFDRYTVFEDIAKGNTTTPPPGGHSNKIYGSEENPISITETTSDDGTNVEVKWTISYNPKKFAKEKAVKIVLPKDFTDLKFGGASKEKMLMINEDTVRIQSDAAVSAEIEFVLPKTSFDSKYIGLHEYFNIPGASSTITITL